MVTSNQCIQENVETKTKSNTQIALESIKKMILTSELRAGTNHLEKELAEKLGMSRTPVREATLILETQGLLEIVPRHGVKILPLSITDMREIYEVLTALEGKAAELAAEQTFHPNEFAAAEEAIAMMDEALEKDDREAWAIADSNFHTELINLAGNSRMASITEMFFDQVQHARAITLYLRPSPTNSNEDHRTVLNAIKAGASKTARDIHTQHRKKSGSLLISILDKHRLIAD